MGFHQMSSLISMTEDNQNQDESIIQKLKRRTKPRSDKAKQQIKDKILHR